MSKRPTVGGLLFSVFIPVDAAWTVPASSAAKMALAKPFGLNKNGTFWGESAKQANLLLVAIKSKVRQAVETSSLQ